MTTTTSSTITPRHPVRVIAAMLRTRSRRTAYLDVVAAAAWCDEEWARFEASATSEDREIRTIPVQHPADHHHDLETSFAEWVYEYGLLPPTAQRIVGVPQLDCSDHYLRNSTNRSDSIIVEPSDIESWM